MRRTELTTTFAKLKATSAYESGYKKLAQHLGGITKYGKDTPINLLTILESNGVDDMMWSLRAVDNPDVERIARFIACDCAEASLVEYEEYTPDDNRPRVAIETARRFADGTATQEEMSAAQSAAQSAAESAAWSAARSAARAAAWSTARSAARSAAESAARSAARSVAESAAQSAAQSVAESAAWSAAWSAAQSVAESAAESAQAEIIKKYLK